MKITAGRVRFVLEAAFIVVVAAVCWAAQLTWRGIVPAMAGAWLLVTLVERSATQDHSELREGKLGFLFRRRSRAAAEPAAAGRVPPPPSHVTVHEPQATAEHPPMPTPPEPVPPPAPEPGPPVPEPEPTPEPGEPVPQLEVVPELPPEPEPEPEAAPEPVPAVAYLQPRDGAGTREWNVWELERLARETEGRNFERDQELAFLLVELRQFANADGRLAASFDPLVRESFGDLLYASA
jgi:outer membrane biosynthesis protein TonB